MLVHDRQSDQTHFIYSTLVHCMWCRNSSQIATFCCLCSKHCPCFSVHSSIRLLQWTIELIKTELLFRHQQDMLWYLGTSVRIRLHGEYVLVCGHTGVIKTINNRFLSFIPGFNGTNCEHNIDDCPGHQCANRGTCIDGVNTYNCQCPPEWTGTENWYILTINKTRVLAYCREYFISKLD